MAARWKKVEAEVMPGGVAGAGEQFGSIGSKSSGGGGGAVSSVSNSDGTVTVSPTTGAVVVSRPAITGDVSVPAGSDTSTVQTIQGDALGSQALRTLLGTGTQLSYTTNATSFVANPNSVNDITAASVVAVLPASCNVGDIVVVRSAAAVTFTIDANTGQTLNGGSAITVTTGAGTQNMSVIIVCTVANTSWKTIGVAGTDAGQNFVCTNTFVANGYAEFNGGMFFNPLNVSSNTTIVEGAISYAATGSSNITLTFGTALLAGGYYVITNTGTGTVTLAAAGSGTVAGQTTLSLPPQSGVICKVQSPGASPVIELYAAFGIPSDTANFAAFTTATPTSGVAFTPLSTGDSEIFFYVTTPGTLTLTMGPSTGAEHTLVNAQAVTAGNAFTKRIPMNWKVVVTLTTAVISTVQIQSL
jgi:hypothetical protein